MCVCVRDRLVCVCVYGDEGCVIGCAFVWISSIMLSSFFRGLAFPPPLSKLALLCMRCLLENCTCVCNNCWHQSIPLSLCWSDTAGSNLDWTLMLIYHFSFVYTKPYVRCLRRIASFFLSCPNYNVSYMRMDKWAAFFSNWCSWGVSVLFERRILKKKKRNERI